MRHIQTAPGLIEAMSVPGVTFPMTVELRNTAHPAVMEPETRELVPAMGLARVVVTEAGRLLRIISNAQQLNRLARLGGDEGLQVWIAVPDSQGGASSQDDGAAGATQSGDAPGAPAAQEPEAGAQPPSGAAIGQPGDAPKQPAAALRSRRNK